MMETKKLRKADFITSIILLIFGLWILTEAFQMPMQGSYGGVKSVWYVSPAFLPLIIGFAIIVLGVVLLINSIRTGGAAGFIQSLKAVKLKLSDSTQRFLGILLAIIAFVYLYIPRVDFFVSIVLFLSFFIPAFFYDDMHTLRRLAAVYAGLSLLMIISFASPIAELMNGAFEFATDVIALLGAVGINVYAARLARRNDGNRKRYRIGLIVIIVTPLFLTPVFRFALLVPLPHEGGIVQLMQLVYYSIR